MATKTQLLPITPVHTEMALRQWLISVPTDHLMTRPQFRAIVARLTPMLPANLALSYRTPKGYLYVDLYEPNGAHVSTLTLSNRAKWYETRKVHGT